MGETTEIDLVKYGALYQDVQNMKDDVKSIKADIKEINRAIAQLTELANRSKGALWIVMTIVGTGVALIGLILKLLKGG